MIMPRRSASKLALAASAALLAAGCTVGPNYQRPTAPIATHFKEAEGWRPAQPADGIDKGRWWSMFNDPTLDSLEQRVASANQTVAQAFYAYREAHQIIAEARSQYFPTLSGSGGVTASGSIGNRGGGAIGTSAGGTTVFTGGGVGTVTTYTATLDGSWAPDLWGRIRRTVEGDVASAQASAADLANARLSAQGELALDYFQLRIVEQQAQLYRDTIAAYQRFLQLTQNQYAAGTVARTNVISAQTQLLAAQASLVSTEQTRGQLEHAIAVLVGVPPSELTIPAGPLSRTVPVPPTDLPSTLLERRPDIAAAERRTKAANAQIGIAEAAFYPDLTLSGSFGFDATNLGQLFNAASNIWSVGAQLSDTLLEFGGRRAAVRAARAAYDEQVAAYRQTVLSAFQTVEDELVALRVLQRQADVVAQEEAAAREAEQLALNQYRAGQVDYTTVITAQTAALNASQSVLNTLEQRLLASVGLVQALGGGWTTADLPKS